MKVKSPLRYPGGKSKAVKYLLSYFPEEIWDYREPFLGGGSVYLSVYDRCKSAWLNDAYAPLMAFWGQIQQDAGRLAEYATVHRQKLRTAADCRRYWECCLESAPLGQFEQAWRFYFFNRVSFGGTTDSGGFSSAAANSRFTLSSINSLVGLQKPLSEALLTCGDYGQLLKGEGAFVYLDPPYVTAKRLYGNRGGLHSSFSHELLAERLHECRHSWLLSYDDCDKVRRLYKDKEIIQLPNWKYGNGKESRELLIRSTV